MSGLAEALRAARMRLRAGESSASLPIIEGGQESNAGRGTDCLAERIRKVRERVRRLQGPETSP